MKINKLPGFVMADIAYEYYNFLNEEREKRGLAAKTINRMQAKKNFLNLRKVEPFLVLKAMDLIYNRNRDLLWEKFKES